MQGSLRQGILPPQALDAGDAARILDRLAKLLVDYPHLRSSRRFAIPYAGEAKEIAWKLRAARMEDKGSAHSEDSAEKTSFEDHIVSRRSLSGLWRRRCRRACTGPVVPSEH